ncbi:MAG: protein kinase, partial [Gemmatimonadales bacterium]
GRVLGRLNHPNIARLLDAGVAGGQPYLVLEYVEGERIDEFADRLRAPPAERIRLAIQVLDALAIAHASLIIHRDIKPSNILVAGAGRIKLLDFGIAKLLLEGRSVGEPTTLTESGGRALTPEFAAPEVIRGDPVSAATDIYSTGVLLFSLLSGRHPTGEGCTTAAAHLQAVVETEPTRLSEAIGRGRTDPAEAAARGSTADRLRRQYQGDLDNILAKALRKEPEARYQTAAEFREDLQRFLDHLPVRARPDTVGYRVRKYLRRNRKTLAAGGLAAASLLGGTLVSLRQMQIANRARERAERALRRSEATTSFESLLFRLIDPNGEAITYRQLLDRGRIALEQKYRGDPVSRVQVGIQFAQNYLREGNDTAAVAVLARTTQVADSVGDPQWQARARCELAIAVALAGNPDSSRRLITASDEFLRRVADPERGTLNACDQAGGVWGFEAGRPDSSAYFFDRQVRRMKASSETDAGDYMTALNDLARSQFAAGETRNLLVTTAEVLAMAHQGANGDPADLPIMQFNAFLVRERLGEPLETLAFLRGETRAMSHPDSVSPLLWLATGRTFASLEQADSAAFYFRRALQHGRLDPTNAYLTEWHLGRLAQNAGDPAAADRFRQAAATRLRDSPPDLRPDTTDFQFRVEVAIDRLAAIDPATLGTVPLDSAIGRALGVASYRPGQRAPNMVAPLALATEVAIRAGRLDLAERFARHIVAIGSPDSIAAGRSLASGRGLVLEARIRRIEGKLAEAERLARQASGILATALGPQHPRTRAALALADSLTGR